MRIYIVNIYQSEESNPHDLVGMVKEVGTEEKKAFTNIDELWKILNLMEKDSKQYKKCMEGNNDNRLTKSSSGNKINEIKYPDLVKKIGNQSLLSGSQVIPDLCGEYVAFEDLSAGKYLIKLWHVRTGVVFEVSAGIALNAPRAPKATVPCSPTNPKCKR